MTTQDNIPTTKAKTPYRQNRIDYIVYHDPDAVRALIESFNYEPPEDLHELVTATKEAIRLEGRPFLFELIHLHPDAAIIAQQMMEEEEEYPEASYCGACGHANLKYDGGPDMGPEIPLLEMTDEELQAYYEELKAEAAEFPDDPSLNQQIELVWNALRRRTAPHTTAPQKEQEKEKAQERRDDADDKKKATFSLGGATLLLTMGVIFLAGLVFAKL